MNTFQWTRKDLLSLYDLDAQEIEFILDTAAEFKKVSARKVKKVPALRGKTVVNFFFEPSTRTRVSFELAEQRLSADIVNVTASTSSLTKGESLLDTVRNIEALNVDLLVMRHPVPGAANFVAERSVPGWLMPAMEPTVILRRHCWICLQSANTKAGSKA